MNVQNDLGQRAVVVGGGMAGLFVSRVLSDHFDEVLILERDHEPRNDDPRGAIPQGHHFHVLLPGGLDAITGWFDGFVDDLVRSGAVELVLGRDFYAYTTAGKSYSPFSHQPEPIEGATTYVQTRPQLEMNVRRRLSALPNVSFRHRALVQGPITEQGRVVGVTLRDGEQIGADLVVDASGRIGSATGWMHEIGYDEVPESYVNCDVHYTSLIVQPAEWDAFEGSVFFVMPSGEGEYGARNGAVVKLSEDRWLVSLGSRYADGAPTDWDGFRAFGKTLIHPIWDQLVATTSPLGPIKTYRMRRSIRRRYEQLDRFPEGLLPIGDAVCFFNPIYGQGMSAAAGQCRGLEQLLADRATTGAGLDGLAMEYFPVAADWVRGPWAMAAAFDFNNPDCTGDFPLEEVPDLELLAELIESSKPGSAQRYLIDDIVSLRTPLSAVRTAV